jgi:hypothetical protein
MICLPRGAARGFAIGAVSVLALGISGLSACGGNDGSEASGPVGGAADATADATGAQGATDDAMPDHAAQDAGTEVPPPADAGIDAPASDASGAGPADAASDGATEAATDAEWDTANDDGSDAAPDAELDAMMDASRDAPPDAAPDASSDAEPDAAPDASPDATHDASAAPDASSDAAPDAARDASSDAATPDAAGDAAGDATADACTPYRHTITIDGTDDFSSAEHFATTSAGYAGRVAWDANYVYVGMTGSDIASGSMTKWFVVYLSGAGGTTTGVPYNTQTTTLPFPAKWHVRWRADGAVTQALTWNGASWVDAAWNFSGAVFQSGSYIEMRIARSNISSPTTLNFEMNVLSAQTGVEGTYAGVPSTAFTDGYNPSIAHFFSFDLDGCAVPNAFSPM